MGLRRKPDAVQGFPAGGAAPPGDDRTEGARVRVFVHRAHAPGGEGGTVEQMCYVSVGQVLTCVLR